MQYDLDIESRKMKKNLLLNIIVAAIFVVASPGLYAKDYKIGGLEISDPWARSTPGRSKTGAAYIGKIMDFGGLECKVVGLQTALEKVPDIAIFSAGGQTRLIKTLFGGSHES